MFLVVGETEFDSCTRETDERMTQAGKWLVGVVIGTVPKFGLSSMLYTSALLILRNLLDVLELKNFVKPL